MLSAHYWVCVHFVFDCYLLVSRQMDLEFSEMINIEDLIYFLFKASFYLTLILIFFRLIIHAFIWKKEL